MNTPNQPRILCIGEVLWDIIRGQEHIGGALFNLAAHLVKLGSQATILTRIGNDPRGQSAMDQIKQLGVDASLVQIDPKNPTGWARVQLADNGSATYSFPDDPAYNFIEADDALISRIADMKFDAVCFGTLAQKGEQTRQSLMRLLKSARCANVMYDVNIRLNFYPQDILRQSLSFSTVVKLNADEAPLVASRLYETDLPESQLAARLSADFPIRVVCVTKGGDGCTVYAGGDSRSYPCDLVKVADTVGAGDAFSAAFLDHYCRTGDSASSAQRGNRLGAYVASRHGAVPEYDPSIRERLSI